MVSHKLRTRKGKMHVIKDTDTKKKAGVFYTTNSDKFEIVDHVAAIKEFRKRDYKDYIICDPFIGAGDLLKPLLSKIPEIDFYGFDINPKCENDNIHVEKRDILADFPKIWYELNNEHREENDWKNVLVVSNPPYLGKAKAPKECDQYFKKYPMCNDLYKIFIMEMIYQCQDFVCIVPANFWCESADTKVRESLLKNHKILKCSYYNYKAFDGVYIAVTCFSAVYKPETLTSVTNEALIKSLKNVYTFPMRVHYDEVRAVDIEWRGSWPDYLHGEDFLSYINEDKTPLDIRVLKGSSIDVGQKKTNILISCITNGAFPMGAHIISDSDIVFAPDTAVANFCITTSKHLSREVQEKACKKFNEILNMFNEKYHGMFLGCYIEAPRKTMARSIVFRLMSRVIKDILGEKIAQQSSLF